MRRTQSDTLQTIDDLLDSALDLFVQNGFSVVTLEQIAANAGMTRGALYHHFTSKEDLLRALVARERKSFEGGLEELFLLEAAPDKKLRRILDHIVNNFYDNKRFNRFILFTWFRIESKVVDQLFNYQGKTNSRLVTEFTKLISSGQKQGLFSKRISARVSALQLAAAILGVYRLYFQMKGKLGKKDAVSMFRTFYKSLS
jgi:TetR/AcrR family acrAB operon transcriptional repressor